MTNHRDSAGVLAEQPKPRTRIPDPLNAADWSILQPYFAELVERPVATSSELEQWLLDRSELEAACSQSRATLYIAMTANTDDAPTNAAYSAYVENVAPKLEEAVFALDKRFVDLSSRIPLDAERYRVLVRDKKTAAELFRQENVPLQTELSRLGQEYSKIAGGQTVNFDGQERTFAQMVVYQQSTDRAVRERAWRAVADRRLADREAIDSVLDRMVERRHRIARNAGCPTYVEYVFKEKFRFDYTPADCRLFWSSIAKHVVPMMRRLDEQRRRALGIDTLRPWDLAVDVKGRPGLKPFTGGKELFEKSVSVVNRLDPRLGRMLTRLGEGTSQHEQRGFVGPNLDLDSRKGKRPGGYMYVRDRSRMPYIFMNSAGLHRDVMTMVHEAGHAFHSMLAGQDWLVDYRSSPIEFAEVASMSMEHLTMPHWGTKTSPADGFYSNPSDVARAQRDHLEDSLTTLSWIATIDAFQHWMYTNPTHTRVQRDDHWIELDQQFGHALIWEGLEDSRRSMWQRQGHLYNHPLYYIEYGIAQLGAFQLWLKGKKEGEPAAVDAYIRALTLGGSKPLPELFSAAGIRFDFGEKTIASIVEAVEQELSTMPE